MIRLAWASVAVLAITPAQDILELGGHARMNVPGVADGNWLWRLRSGQVQQDHWQRLHSLTRIYNRLPQRCNDVTD
jgi:4-alpha-glucanotransferase